MKCMIVDDEKMARMALRKLCGKIDTLEIIGEFENPVQAMPVLQEEDLDLIFLDIHMPELTGLEFLESMRTAPEVIITTTDTNFAVEAFEYDVADYLIKPISTARFLKAIDRVKSRLQPANSPANEGLPSSLFINVNSRLIKIDVDNILVLEAKGDYVQIRMPDKKHLVHTTLKRFLSKLPADKFVKVHRSYIVNIDKIIDIEDNSILIAEEIIPVSRRNKEELMDKLHLI